MSNLYSTIKQSLHDVLVEGLNASPHRVNVSKGHYQNEMAFPLVAMELAERTKKKRGLGIYEVTFLVNLWVYTDCLDFDEAEEQCLEVLDTVEKILEKNRTLNGTISLVNIDDTTEFGTVNPGEANSLQGAKLPVAITSKCIAKEA